MKKNSIVILSIVITSIVLASCAKKEAPANIYSKIVGKWMKVQYATDDNNNGVLDPGEISNVPAGVDNELNIKADRTGIETSVINKEPSIPLSFTWEIIQGGDSLRLSYKANDTITYSITSISATKLTISNATKQGLAWYLYNKL